MTYPSLLGRALASPSVSSLHFWVNKGIPLTRDNLLMFSSIPFPLHWVFACVLPFLCLIPSISPDFLLEMPSILVSPAWKLSCEPPPKEDQVVLCCLYFLPSLHSIFSFQCYTGFLRSRHNLAKYDLFQPSFCLTSHLKFLLW